MPLLKHTAELTGMCLKDVPQANSISCTLLHKTFKKGYGSIIPRQMRTVELIIRDGITYAINELFVDWDDNDMLVWNPNDMGQWPFGNQLSDEEVLMNTIDDVLFSLDSYLENELEWMDRLEDEENEASDIDDDSDIDVVSEDEGYNTSPEVTLTCLTIGHWASTVTCGELTCIRIVKMGFGPCN